VKLKVKRDSKKKTEELEGMYFMHVLRQQSIVKQSSVTNIDIGRVTDGSLQKSGKKFLKSQGKVRTQKFLSEINRKLPSKHALDFGGSFEEQLHGSAQQLNSNRR
jgi:hypothetical protein